MKAFLRKNILQTSDSDSKLTLSVMLGIFMGIVPIWGYQLITAIALAYVLRLNKLIVIVSGQYQHTSNDPFYSLPELYYRWFHCIGRISYGI